MKLAEFRALTDGLNGDLEIGIHIDNKNQVGPTPTVGIESIIQGIDWDASKLLIYTDKSISESEFMHKGINIRRLIWISNNKKWQAIFDTNCTGKITTNYGYNTAEFKLDRDGTLKTSRGKARYTIASIPDYIKSELQTMIKALNWDITKLVFTEATWDSSSNTITTRGSNLSISEIDMSKSYIIHTRKRVQ